MTLLSVIVPSWNSRELTRACLVALRTAVHGAGLAGDAELIVIDNGSEDDTSELVRHVFPDVVLLANERNEGFARAVNQGLAAASGEHVLLLNSDAELDAPDLAALLGFLRANPAYGAVAPRLVGDDGTTQRALMAFPRLRTALFFGTPLERLLPNSRELRRYFARSFDYGGNSDVEQPPAACLLLSRACLDAVGTFDEDLWLFFNDVDYCKRIHAAGFGIRYLAECAVRHRGGASTRSYADFVPRWHADRLRYYAKHHGRLGRLCVKACVAWTFVDFAARSWCGRLLGRRSEPVAPLGRALKTFLRS